MTAATEELPGPASVVAASTPPVANVPQYHHLPVPVMQQTTLGVPSVAQPPLHATLGGVVGAVASATAASAAPSSSGSGVVHV